MDSSHFIPLVHPSPNIAITRTGNASLQGISLYLQEGNQPSPSRVKVSPSFFVISTCKNILHELMKRGNLTDICITSTHHRLREIDGSVELSNGTESPALIFKNTSLREIQLNLVNNLIIKNKHSPCSADTIQLLLNQAMTHLESHPEEFVQCPEFYTNVAIYILDHPTISIELLFVTVKNVIRHAEHDSLKLASRAVAIALQYSENCGSKKSAEAAQYILESREIKYCDASKISAILYIVLQAYSFPPRLFTVAANHIIHHMEDYPRGFVITAAQNFIKQNTRFFNEPIKNQKEFIKFYVSRGEILTITDYSDKLTKLLEADGRKIPVNIKCSDSEKLIRSERSVLELWHLGHFNHALENETVSIFILKNTQHDAITLWNNDGKLFKIS